MNTERRIYRSRHPVEMNGASGWLDLWTTDELKARREASAVAGRRFEALTLDDIAKMPPAAQLKARAAWANAFPE